MPLESLSSDPFVIGDLVKLFLAELPEPLLTYQLFPKFAVFGEDKSPPPPGTNVADDKVLSALKWVVQQLPTPNTVVVFYLLVFLRYWTETSGVELKHTASIFGPHFLRPREDADVYPDNLATVVERVLLLLLHFHSQVPLLFTPS